MKRYSQTRQTNRHHARRVPSSLNTPANTPGPIPVPTPVADTAEDAKKARRQRFEDWRTAITITFGILGWGVAFLSLSWNFYKNALDTHTKTNVIVRNAFDLGFEVENSALISHSYSGKSFHKEINPSADQLMALADIHNSAKAIGLDADGFMQGFVAPNQTDVEHTAALNNIINEMRNQIAVNHKEDAPTAVAAFDLGQKLGDLRNQNVEFMDALPADTESPNSFSGMIYGSGEPFNKLLKQMQLNITVPVLDERSGVVTTSSSGQKMVTIIGENGVRMTFPYGTLMTSNSFFHKKGVNELRTFVDKLVTDVNTELK